ncbi:MAG: HAD-IA family hydrolase [Gammaproteobacteria bacterium]|nr:HAD-IA family hydrolase [Gammaproteobacteria bacterium]NIM72105.1 HAD-IA family hydrolase [Gammaproteobacteria bacterium]NIN38386.1 HAD-IA family hydrolase [Gammaproteobacteria bacterium]NIO23832.1 HAD-IA family hydrolase [Gammaproteobacteria bacterium]NIO64474.1 HAD-IA family hydrolase [Gammaproteobacteria bacterium]
MVKAITFDLWDTVIHDDSDEQKRSAQGLASKRETRRALAHEIIGRHSPLDAHSLRVAYDTMEAAFNHVWHDQHITWTVDERVTVLLAGLGRTLPDADRSELVRSLEEMEVTVTPNPVEGIAEAIAALADSYKLAVVSDAIYSPGRCLRQWLEMHDLIQHFDAFAFSDEIGHSKPHRDMFASVAAQLGVQIEEMLHIGDRDHNDIKGPHALGMKAVLFTATRDRDKAHTSADAVCERAAELPEVVRRVAGASQAHS